MRVPCSFISPPSEYFCTSPLCVTPVRKNINSSVCPTDQVTHAVANTIKRVAVIVVSVLYFNNPLTLKGAAGSAVAIVGVFLYSIAKVSSHDS